MGHTTQLGNTIVPVSKKAPRSSGRPVLHTPAAPSKARLSQEETLAISRAAMCEGKPSYATAARAWATVKHRNGRPGGKSRASVLEPYRCPHCGSWHIGGK